MEDIPKEYDGRFLNDDKMTQVIQDLISVCEKWNLRMMEVGIACDQVKHFYISTHTNQHEQAKINDLWGDARRKFEDMFKDDI